MYTLTPIPQTHNVPKNSVVPLFPCTKNLPYVQQCTVPAVGRALGHTVCGCLGRNIAGGTDIPLSPPPAGISESGRGKLQGHPQTCTGWGRDSAVLFCVGREEYTPAVSTAMMVPAISHRNTHDLLVYCLQRWA